MAVCLYRCPVCGHEEQRLFDYVDPEMIIDVCPDCQYAVMELTTGFAADEQFFENPEEAAEE